MAAATQGTIGSGPEPVVLVDTSDRIATVTLNRPKARNALNTELRKALRATFRALDADDGVDVVVLTGADPAFSAGLDLKELGASGLPNDVEGSQGRPDAGQDAGRDAGRDANRDAVTNSPFPPMHKPVIGAINGVAVTGGFELALNCDLLVASDRARFADTHARVGVMPGWGLTVLLPQAIGVRRARELSFTGNFLDAGTALSWGLVNHVVDHDELLPFARSLAADIVSNDQAGVRRMRQTYAEGAGRTGAEAMVLEAEVANRWLRDGGGDAAEIERRRGAIAERGRTQSS